MLLVCIGCALIYFQNIENDQRWIGHYASKTTNISVILQEPLTDKPNSYKALAKVESVLVNDEWIMDYKRPCTHIWILGYALNAVAASRICST